MVPPIQNGGFGCIRALGLQVLLHLLAVAVLPGVHLQNGEGLRELLEVQLALCNTLFVSLGASLELPSSQGIQAHSHESVPVPIPQFSCGLIIILQGEEALDKVIVLNLFGEIELELRALTGRILREVVALRPCVSEVVVSELLGQSIDYHVLHYTICFHLVKAGAKAVFLDDAADSIGVVDFFEYSVGNQQVVEHGAHQDLISELNGQIAVQSVLLFLYLEYPPMVPADSLQLAPEEVLGFPPIDSSNNQLHANHPEQSECILLAVLIIDLEGKEYPLFLLGLYLNIALQASKCLRIEPELQVLEGHSVHVLSLNREPGKILDAQVCFLGGLSSPKSVSRFLLDLVELVRQLYLLPLHEDIQLHSVRDLCLHVFDFATIVMNLSVFLNPESEILPRGQVVGERGGLHVGILVAVVVDEVGVNGPESLQL